MSYLDVALAKIEEFEGSVPWMYLDTRGLVTVAVGRMLPNEDSACALPFVMFNGEPAPRAVVAAEYARVKALPAGRPSVFYHSSTSATPTLPQPAIGNLLRQIVVGDDSTLDSFVTGYATFPDGVKDALLDMCYNLGDDGLLKGYPHLIQACEAHNWQLAAINSHRFGPNADRNAWTKQQFLEAV